jgi:hypothetical protein
MQMDAKKKQAQAASAVAQTPSRTAINLTCAPIGTA